jgi:hypothetical protein
VAIGPQTVMAIHPRSSGRGILAFSRKGYVLIHAIFPQNHFQISIPAFIVSGN